MDDSCNDKNIYLRFSPFGGLNTPQAALAGTLSDTF